MKTTLNVTIELDTANPGEAGRFEEKLRGWARHQAGVAGISVAPATDNTVRWRASRLEAFGSRLRNPFGRTRIGS